MVFYISSVDRRDLLKAPVKALIISSPSPVTVVPLGRKLVVKRTTDSLTG